MTGRRRAGWPLLVFGAYSVLVWISRARNIAEDASLSGGERVLWLVPVAIFVVGGAVTLAAWWRGGLEVVVAAFALWTMAYWAVRTVLMAGNGHEAAFVVVHVVLALVATALSLWTLAHLRRQARAGHRMAGAAASR